jgi:hypothetical protein
MKGSERKMAPERNWKKLATMTNLIVIIILLAVLYPSYAQGPQQGVLTLSGIATTPKSVWFELLQRSPYPFTIPLPPPIRTIIDGTYTKFELKETPPVHCRRCPDYAPEGGIWKLSLDKGVFRIFHEVTGWKSLGTFIVTRDEPSSPRSGQLVLANDPTCQEVIGVYNWKLEEGKLILTVIEDKCAIRLRAMNLTNLPWLSCQPPSTEAAITDHWPKPPGCE